MFKISLETLISRIGLLLFLSLCTDAFGQNRSVCKRYEIPEEKDKLGRGAYEDSTYHHGVDLPSGNMFLRTGHQEATVVLGGLYRCTDYNPQTHLGMRGCNAQQSLCAFLIKLTTGDVGGACNVQVLPRRKTSMSAVRRLTSLAPRLAPSTVCKQQRRGFAAEGDDHFAGADVTCCNGYAAAAAAAQVICL